MITRIEEENARFGNFIYQGIARLSAEATVSTARAEIHRLMRDAADRYSVNGGGHSRASLDEGHYVPIVERLKDAVVGDIGDVIWIMMGTVILVLLIAAANVTNLFVLRAESMRKELAIRTALGASRRSAARLFLVEGLTLSTAGGLVGLLIASLGTRHVLGLAPSDLPRADQLGLDATVLGSSSRSPCCRVCFSDSYRWSAIASWTLSRTMGRKPHDHGRWVPAPRT